MKTEKEFVSKMEYKFIDKTIFFPEHGILAIGDLHVGFEQSLREAGVNLPESQTNETTKNLQMIIEEIKKSNWKLKKIIFLGDIKHYFGYEWREKVHFNKILDFLKQFVEDSDIILIKGNHDKFDFSGKKMKNCHIKDKIAFFHGHISFPQIMDKEVNMWVMGHLHPSILLSEKEGVKREKFKCFLVGKYKGKEIIIIPSFIGITEGTPVNEQRYENEKEFSVIPHKEIRNFKAYVIGDNQIFDFGKVKEL
ncbi:metallophosphoesterase [Candidatus Pacearchaeota archaeon]|nr:metallophosphoesterase [Candidatus Pacearchaeota archaeon]